jgi:hypothetical protein
VARAFVDQISDTLELDPDGRSTGSHEARFQARAGRWRHFHSSGDFAVLLRDGGSTPEVVLERKVVLAGDLSAVSSADLAMFLSQTRFTGVVLARAHGVDRTLSVKLGKLCWGSSSEPSERLGEVCVRHGLVDRHALAKLNELPDDEGRRVGQRLVEAKLLNGHDLWRAMQLQVSEIFWALLLKSAGTFVVVDAPDDPSLDSHLALDMQGLLLEGVRRVDELRHFQRRLASPELKPRVEASLPDGATLEEQAIYALVNGKRTIVELGIESRLGEFEATKALHHLLEGGIVGIDAPPPRERTPGPKSVDSSVLIATYNEVLSEILNAVRSSGLDGPYRISVDSFLLGEQRATRAIQGLSLETDGTLSEEKLLLSLQKPGNSMQGPEAMLKTLLESVSKFALFQAREILDDGEADLLVKRARTLLSN